ncbi:MAG TPA: hypothetical protein VFN10_05965 [Thermoanaerobaculia bacterium]|nr:hypothetical protein [Thermoanaerobaculia bacterium]
MDDVIEDSLWNAIRALEERAMLIRQASAHARNAHGDSERLLRSAEETQRRANLVRQAVMNDPSAGAGVR